MHLRSFLDLNTQNLLNNASNTDNNANPANLDANKINALNNLINNQTVRSLNFTNNVIRSCKPLFFLIFSKKLELIFFLFFSFEFAPVGQQRRWDYGSGAVLERNRGWSR